MDQIMQSIIDRTLLLEKEFSQNHYLGNTKGNLFKYIEGTIPVILSAPHSVSQIRNGRSKKPDIFTGSLSMILHELTDCHLIYRSFTGEGDANRDLECPYKKHLIERILEKDICYLIDLHGMAQDRAFDIDVGTLQGKTTSFDVEALILDSFYSFNIRDVRFDYMFDGDKKGTVTKTIWHSTGIHCFQIEINNIYRNIKVKKNYVNFYNLIRSLEQLIMVIWLKKSCN